MTPCQFLNSVLLEEIVWETFPDLEHFLGWEYLRNQEGFKYFPLLIMSSQQDPSPPPRSSRVSQGKSGFAISMRTWKLCLF